MKNKSRVTEYNSISGFSNVVLNACFIVYSLACILPLALILSISLSDEASIINTGYRFIPESVSLKSYAFLLKDPNMIGRAYAVTIFIMVAGVVLNVIINSMYAYAISRKDFPFSSFFSIVILITLLFNGGIPMFYYVYVRILHLKDSLLALLLPGLGAGFYIFVMRTYFRQNVPVEIIESAKMDGAKETKIFFSLVLPLSLPILATVSLFSAIYYWNDFFNSLLFIEDRKLYNLQYTMQRAIMNMEFIRRQLSLLASSSASQISRSVSSQVPTETVRMAMVILGIGPIIILYPFLQKYFIKGLTVGSIKG